MLIKEPRSDSISVSFHTLKLRTAENWGRKDRSTSSLQPDEAAAAVLHLLAALDYFKASA